MRLSGYQPQYFPRLHYFARMLNSDIFEISDYLQFVRKHAYPLADGSMKRGKSYQAHAPIKLAGGAYLLSIPTKHQGILPINRTNINYLEPWPEKHLKSLKSAYSKALNFKRLFPFIDGLLRHKFATLAELNIATIFWALSYLLDGEDLTATEIRLVDINTWLRRRNPFRLSKIVIMSTTDIKAHDETKDASDWLIQVCRLLKADEYFFGGTSKTAYMNIDKFKAAGIRLTQQNWQCPVYSQKFTTVGFLANLSIIDLLMNVEREKAVQILKDD